MLVQGSTVFVLVQGSTANLGMYMGSPVTADTAVTSYGDSISPQVNMKPILLSS